MAVDPAQPQTANDRSRYIRQRPERSEEGGASCQCRTEHTQQLQAGPADPVDEDCRLHDAVPTAGAEEGVGQGGERDCGCQGAQGAGNRSGVGAVSQVPAKEAAGERLREDQHGGRRRN